MSNLNKKSNKMHQFVYNESDQPYMMYDKLTSYMSKLKVQKKTKILELFNKIFNMENESLRHFKKITIDYFTNNKNLEKIISLLEKEETNLNLKLNKIKEYKKQNYNNLVDTSESVSDTDSDCSNDSDDSDDDDFKRSFKFKKTNINETIDINKEIFYVLSFLLKNIEFKFQKYIEHNKSYYKIVMF